MTGTSSSSAHICKKYTKMYINATENRIFVAHICPPWTAQIHPSIWHAASSGPSIQISQCKTCPKSACTAMLVVCRTAPKQRLGIHNDNVTPLEMVVEGHMVKSGERHRGKRPNLS